LASSNKTAPVEKSSDNAVRVMLTDDARRPKNLKW
jgi:hypothetical protein